MKKRLEDSVYRLVVAEVGDYERKKRKLAELTHGAIEAGVFKFLQINAVNRLLNQTYVEDKD